MTKMGRRHRPYFRIVATDARSPRDGKYLEALGTYDPLKRDKDARVSLKADRVKYWLSVGAQPSKKVNILLKKYLDKQPASPKKGTEPAEEGSAASD